MRCLLDTHAIIWCIDRGNSKLSQKARDIIIDPENTIFISSASLWEIVIKISLGKLDLDFDNLLKELDLAGFLMLHTEAAYLQRIIRLPLIHKDPFDRLLVATAQAESMVLITSDDNIHQYDVQCAW